MSLFDLTCQQENHNIHTSAITIADVLKRYEAYSSAQIVTRDRVDAPQEEQRGKRISFFLFG